MKSPAHSALRPAKGFWAMAMALLYLLAFTQIAFPVRQGVAALAKAETAVQKEAFACALHKCGCKNALQCRTKCCCFPKAAPSHAHDQGEEQGQAENPLSQYKTCTGPDGHGDGTLPSLSAHLPLPSAALPAPDPFRNPLAADTDRPPSPVSDAPQKIPI